MYLWKVPVSWFILSGLIKSVFVTVHVFMLRRCRCVLWTSAVMMPGSLQDIKQLICSQLWACSWLCRYSSVSSRSPERMCASVQGGWGVSIAWFPSEWLLSKLTFTDFLVLTAFQLDNPNSTTRINFQWIKKKSGLQQSLVFFFCSLCQLYRILQIYLKRKMGLCSLFALIPVFY